MKIDHSINGNIAEIKFSGSLDLNTQAIFYDYFISILPKSNKCIALNFENVDYIDSPGIGILVKCMGDSKRKKIELIFYGLNERLQRIFKVAKLDTFFNFQTVDEFKKNNYNLDEIDDLLD